jgi:hypothetical protein
LLSVHSRYGPLARSLLQEAFDCPLGHKNLFSWLDTASECSGAYPGGTLIRWNSAAFTTHHGAHDSKKSRTCPPRKRPYRYLPARSEYAEVLVGNALGVMGGVPDSWAVPLGDRLETYLKGKENLSIMTPAARTARLALAE